MTKVFISHVVEDNDKAQYIKMIFEQGTDIRCWEFRSGSGPAPTSLTQEIVDRISQSEYFLLLWSRAAAERPAWVTYELEHALNVHMQWQNQGREDAFILVIRLDDEPLPSRVDGFKYHLYSDQELVNLKHYIAETAPRLQALTATPETLDGVEAITAGQIMTEDLVTIASDATIERALTYMRSGEFRHLVVIDEDSGKTAGFVTIRDLLVRFTPALDFIKKTQKIDANTFRDILDEIAETPVSDCMTPYNRLIRLGPEASAHQVLDRLIRRHVFGGGKSNRVSALPVVDDERQVTLGIVSYVDVLTQLPVPNETVGQRMTPQADLITASLDDTLERVYIRMDAGEKRHLPVLDKDFIFQGMIDDLSVLHVMHRDFRDLSDRPVSEFLRHKESLARLSPEHPLTEVVPIMLQDTYTNALPVLEGDTLVGILSYVDILCAIYHYATGEEHHQCGSG